MNDLDTGVHPRAGRLQIPRSRGAASGFLLLLLGVWGALIPFIGPYFNFAYTPSCAYSDRWVCPLAPPLNRLPIPVTAGEMSVP